MQYSSNDLQGFRDFGCANFSCGVLFELRRSELTEQLKLAQPKSENEACLKILHLLYNLMIK